MADSHDKAVKFIAKLLRMTQEKKLEWSPAPTGGFFSQIEDRRLFVTRDREGLYWEYTLVVSPLEEGAASYSFVDTTGLDDLWESARFTASKIEELMDTVLAKE